MSILVKFNYITSEEKRKKKKTESGKHIILYRNHLNVNPMSIINDVSIQSNLRVRPPVVGHHLPKETTFQNIKCSQTKSYTETSRKRPPSVSERDPFFG